MSVQQKYEYAELTSDYRLFVKARRISFLIAFIVSSLDEIFADGNFLHIWQRGTFYAAYFVYLFSTRLLICILDARI